jgi:hypothetical protein
MVDRTRRSRVRRALAASAAARDSRLRFTTDDAEADHTTLRVRGVDTDAEVMRYPVPMFAFRDPDGSRFRIVERPRGSVIAG